MKTKKNNNNISQSYIHLPSKWLLETGFPNSFLTNKHQPGSVDILLSCLYSLVVRLKSFWSSGKNLQRDSWGHLIRTPRRNEEIWNSIWIEDTLFAPPPKKKITTWAKAEKISYCYWGDRLHCVYGIPLLTTRDRSCLHQWSVIIWDVQTCQKILNHSHTQDSLSQGYGFDSRSVHMPLDKACVHNFFLSRPKYAKLAPDRKWFLVMVTCRNGGWAKPGPIMA